MARLEGIIISTVSIGFAYFVATEIGTVAAGHWGDVADALRLALRH